MSTFRGEFQRDPGSLGESSLVVRTSPAVKRTQQATLEQAFRTLLEQATDAAVPWLRGGWIDPNAITSPIDELTGVILHSTQTIARHCASSDHRTCAFESSIGKDAELEFAWLASLAQDLVSRSSWNQWRNVLANPLRPEMGEDQTLASVFRLEENLAQMGVSLTPLED